MSATGTPAFIIRSDRVESAYCTIKHECEIRVPLPRWAAAETEPALVEYLKYQMESIGVVLLKQDWHVSWIMR